MQNPAQTLVRNLLLLARHAHIVHHIPGRIRLRLSPSVLKVAGQIDLDQLLNGIPGVIKTRTNVIVGSVVIEYDRNRLSQDLLELVAGYNGDSGEASEIESRLTALLKS